MSAIKDGGTAFPIPDIYHPNGEIVQFANTGMTMRDYFAAKALPSVIIQCARDTMHDMTEEDYFAMRAYKLADAMLRARGKK